MSAFVWADLSSDDPEESKRFYTGVFGWDYVEAGAYSVAAKDGVDVAGIFETPEVFQRLGMPSFWMSYLAVDDAERVAEAARAYPGATVELVDEAYGGKAALVRDPSGAGFTAYDGRPMSQRSRRPGNLCWNELHVASAEAVLPFYERLFGWETVEAASPGAYRVLAAGGQHIADIAEVPSEIKGKAEYWVCTFAVEDLDEATHAAVAHGGGIVRDEGRRRLLHDNSGQAVFYLQS